MDTEYILFIQDHLGTPEFLKALTSQKIRFQYYSSKNHHPHAMLMHRSQITKRVVSSSFPGNQKSLILYFPSFSSIDFQETTKFLERYKNNQVKTIVIIQGIEEFFENSKYLESNEKDGRSRENFEFLLVEWMMNGTDCILTESYRESAGFIDKIIEILTKNPYRADPSKFRIQGKKLKPNTAVPVKQRNWALQLVNIQGISESKALKIMEKFPDLPSLIEFYQDSLVSNKDKEQALTFISERKEKRLSKRVFSVFSSVKGDLAV
jgi:hypothetical protein